MAAISRGATAVRRPAAVPAAVGLGEPERRGPPGGLVQWWLHVVVGVEQHGRRPRGVARPGPDDGEAAVGGPGQVPVGETDAGEPAADPLRRPGTLRRWVLAG